MITFRKITQKNNQFREWVGFCVTTDIIIIVNNITNNKILYG